MIRKLVLLTALTFLTAWDAYGVGLGELQLNSALNQSFDAVIVITNEERLTPEEIRPGLASQADFDRLGVERTDVLTDLRFSVEQSADGTTRVLITSRKPIIEPYLNFLVEVLWPAGRLLREYTVLLDPPVFGADGIEPIEVTPSVSAGSGKTRPATSPRQSQPSTSAGSTGAGKVTQGEYGMTGPGDTLWSIAANVRPDPGVSVQQVMLAIQRANPEAFIDNNINLLKAGHVLRIPDAAVLQQESAAAAMEQVKQQNEAWEEFKSGDGRVAQIDASSRTSTDGDTGSEEDGGELKLLSNSTREGKRAGAGPEDSARVSELESDLAVAMEDLDRTRRANTDLNIRLDDLAGQIETLNQLVQLKDDQLAELQKQLKQVQALAAQATMADLEEPVVEEPSMLSNPLLLGVVGLLIVLGIAGGLFFARRRKSTDDEDLVDELDPLDLDSADETSVMAVSGGEPRATAPEPETDSAEEDVSQQTEDVISEADIYIAYGRFPQAITFLKNAMVAEPARTDIQLKLLEVYAQTKDNSEFNLLFEQLKNSGDDQAVEKALALQASMPGAAEEAAAAMGATVISSEPISAVEEAEDDDLSFDLDDLDSETDDELDLDGLDLDDESLALDIDDEETDQFDTDDSEELDLDLDLDMEQSDTEPPADADSEAGDQLDDLATDELEGLELDLDEAVESAEADLELDDIDLDSTLADESLDEDLGVESPASDDLDAELDLDDIDLDSELDLDADDDLDLDAGEGELNLDEAELDLDLDDEFNLDDDINLDDDLDLESEVSSKLDLARAYIDMGDTEGARNILTEVASSGSDAEQQEANELLSKL